MKDFSQMAEHIKEALRLGQEAADKVEDGGSCNLDHIVICGLKYVKEETLLKAGIPVSSKTGAGAFSLSSFFGGQADKNAKGCQVASKYLKSVGVDNYIYYMMD